MNKRCHNCGGPFGLIRHRNGMRQFCSSRCLESYYARVVDAIRRQAEELPAFAENQNASAFAELGIGSRSS